MTEEKGLTRAQGQVATIRQMLVDRKDQLAAALPRHMSVDRLVRVVLTSVQANPKLVECTVSSLYSAVLQSAQLGLEPDGVLGHAHLVPRRNNKKGCMEAQFLAGYKGLTKLAMQSGKVVSIVARVVHEADIFKFCYGLEKDELTHQLGIKEPGQLTHAYAVARLKEGVPVLEVMTRGQIDEVRKSSAAGSSGPWSTHFDEMARKTVLRRLCKHLDLSPELQRAVALDELADAGVPQDLASTVVDFSQDPVDVQPVMETTPDAEGLQAAEEWALAEPDAEDAKPGTNRPPDLSSPYDPAGEPPQQPPRQTKPNCRPGCGRHLDIVKSVGHAPTCTEAKPEPEPAF
jgi:recombination protein RecT